MKIGCCAFAALAMTSCSDGSHEDSSPSPYDEKKLMDEFTSWIDSCGHVITERLGRSKGDRAIQECIAGFKPLIPKIPWIGGDENPNTFFLMGGAYSMGLVKPLERAGFGQRDIGRMIYQMSECSFGLQRDELRQQGEWMITPQAIGYMREGAAWSQKKAYPDDFVFEFIEPQSEMYYGIKMTECAIQKFYREQKHERYVKYCCLVDYPLYQAYQLHLERTETLGNGGACCDFMYLKTGSTPDGWPPESRPEFKGSA